MVGVNYTIFKDFYLEKCIIIIKLLREIQIIAFNKILYLWGLSSAAK
jgi:hypothetical protein